jgi:hypothetical protein
MGNPEAMKYLCMSLIEILSIMGSSTLILKTSLQFPQLGHIDAFPNPVEQSPRWT